jgi:hypothetical protein
LELTTTHSRLSFQVALTAEPITLDRPMAAGAQLVIARALVHDGGVRERDARNVRGIDYD